MAYTYAWDESAPLGSAPANTLETIIQQQVKIATRERIVDILDIADFTADPIVPRTLKLNRTTTSKILGGTTSLSLRNAADSADNILITDAGLVTLRNTLSGTAATFSTTLAVTGAVTLSSTLAVADDIILSEAIGLIRQNTSDGADSKMVSITGAGAIGVARGGRIDIHGNEHSNTGRIDISAGDVAGGTITLETANTARLTVAYNGAVTLFSTLAVTGATTLASLISSAYVVSFGTIQNPMPINVAATVVRMDVTSPTTIRSMDGGVSGRLVFLLNESSNAVTINHEDGAAVAAERFVLKSGASIVIPGGGGGIFVYLNSRWRSIAEAI